MNVEASVDPKSVVSPSASSVVSLERMSNILGHYFPPVSRSARLLIGVLSAPKNTKRRQKIRETWLKYYDSQSPVSTREYHVWFIVGHADCKQNDKEKMEILMEEAAKYGDMLILPYVTESYHGITEKVMGFFEIAAKFSSSVRRVRSYYSNHKNITHVAYSYHKKIARMTTLE